MEGPYDMSQQKGYKLKGYCNKEIYGERTTQSSKENLFFFLKKSITIPYLRVGTSHQMIYCIGKPAFKSCETQACPIL